MYRRIVPLLALMVVATLSALTNVSALADAPPPNILLITCDNLGYGDLPCFNPQATIKAPYLDRLAKQGAKITSFYTASPTCTVSRACLLTGRIPQRHGLTEQLPGVQGNYGVGLNHHELLIPQLLKTAPAPYATGCFGKWNIGFAKGSRPTERGFDEFIGHASGNMDYYHHNYREQHDLYNGTEALKRDGEYATDLFADAAIDFIQRHSKQKRPWFCYVPFNAPHFPTAGNKRPGQPNVWQAPDWAFDAIGLSKNEADPRKRYEAVVFALDRAIGRVLDSLDDAGQANNTFVFFMSDNGAFRLNRKGLDVGINDPLRSGGVTCWEGGLRVAALARWPGRIKNGSVIDEPFWSPDLFTACAALAEVKLPASLTLDGKNPLPLLTEGATSPHASFYFAYRKHAALRKGDWKIVREKPEEKWRLFHLVDDLAESKDRADDNPKQLAELDSEFLAWTKRVQVVDWMQRLAPLPKVHYSWPLPMSGLSDDVLHHYIRITHAASISGEWAKQADIERAVEACQRVNSLQPKIPSTIAINYSVWHRKFGKDLPPTDFGPTHDAELAQLRTRMTAIQEGVAQANQKRGANVRVSAILFDSEVFTVKKENAPWNAAMTAKYNAAYDLVRKVFPEARIEWYARGAIQRGADWMQAPYFTLKEKGDSFGCSLYQVPEIGYTREAYRRTAANASKHNCNEVTPWIALASGYRRQTDRHHTFSLNWNYDLIYSWQLGREINNRWFGVPERAERFAPWNKAKVAIFYPEPFGRSTDWGRHFVAYVRGANGNKELADLGDASLARP